MLFSTTVFNNISYGFEGATQEAVEKAARDANAHDFISKLPQGYATRVTDATLSGGQRQRIAIARALFRNPRMLVRTSQVPTSTHMLVRRLPMNPPALEGLASYMPWQGQRGENPAAGGLQFAVELATSRLPCCRYWTRLQVH
jgi:ABC transporter